jgi:hypothetical protein
MYLYLIPILLALSIFTVFILIKNIWTRLFTQLFWSILHKLTPWRRPVAIVKPEDVTPELLTTALQRQWPGLRVSTVSHLEIGGAQGSSGRVFRLDIALAQPADPAAPPVPHSLILKLPKDMMSCAFMEASYFNESENRFYQTMLNSGTKFVVPTPKPIMMEHNPRGGFWFLIMEDLNEQKSCDLIVRPKFSEIATVQVALTTLATFHAAFWESPSLVGAGSFGWLKTNEDKYSGYEPLIKSAFPKFIKALGHKIPADIANRGLSLAEYFPFILAENCRSPLTLSHGDATPINGYLIKEENNDKVQFGLYDWPGCNRGKAMFDVALMLNHVPQEVIEKNEESFIRYYLSELHSKTSSNSAKLDYSWEQAMDDYRIGWALTFLRNILGYAVVPLDNDAAKIYNESMYLAAMALHRLNIIDCVRQKAAAAAKRV